MTAPSYGPSMGKRASLRALPAIHGIQESLGQWWDLTSKKRERILVEKWRNKYSRSSALVRCQPNMHGALVLIPSSTREKRDRRDSPEIAHLPGRLARQIQFVKCSTTFKDLPFTTQPGTDKTPWQGLQGRAVTNQLFPSILHSRHTLRSSPTKKQDIRWLLEAASPMDWLVIYSLEKVTQEKHILPWPQPSQLAASQAFPPYSESQKSFINPCAWRRLKTVSCKDRSGLNKPQGNRTQSPAKEIWEMQRCQTRNPAKTMMNYKAVDKTRLTVASSSQVVLNGLWQLGRVFKMLIC